MLWSKTTPLKQRSQWWFLSPLPGILYTQPRMGTHTANSNVSLLKIWLSACTAEENKTLSIKFEDTASRNPTKMTKKLPEYMTWLAHCYCQPTFFHMGKKYRTTCKSYGWFTVFFLCAKVAHLLKSPAVSLGCCWTCLAQYWESVVNQ